MKSPLGEFNDSKTRKAFTPETVALAHSDTRTAFPLLEVIVTGAWS